MADGKAESSGEVQLTVRDLKARRVSAAALDRKTAWPSVSGWRRPRQAAQWARKSTGVLQRRTIAVSLIGALAGCLVGCGSAGSGGSATSLATTGPTTSSPAIRSTSATSTPATPSGAASTPGTAPTADGTSNSFTGDFTFTDADGYSYTGKYGYQANAPHTSTTHDEPGQGSVDFSVSGFVTVTNVTSGHNASLELNFAFFALWPEGSALCPAGALTLDSPSGSYCPYAVLHGAPRGYASVPPGTSATINPDLAGPGYYAGDRSSTPAGHFVYQQLPESSLDAIAALVASGPPLTVLVVSDTAVSSGCTTYEFSDGTRDSVIGSSGGPVRCSQ